MKINHRHTVLLIASLFLQISFCKAQRSGTHIDIDTVQVESETVKDITPLTDADKQSVAERKISRQELDSLRQDDAFWYVNYVREKPKVKPPNEDFISRLFSKSWFRPLIWTLIIAGFIAILVWFLSSGDMKLFRKKPVKIRPEKAEEVGQNIFGIDFDNAIAAAISEGNLRLAVRLQYLQVLRILSDKNIISFNPHKPNSDYVMDLYGTNYYSDFFRITRNFEYAWYGGFPVSASAFDRIREDVAHFKNRVA